MFTLIYTIKAYNMIWIDKNVMMDLQNGMVGHYGFSVTGASNAYLKRWTIHSESNKISGEPVRLSSDTGNRITEKISTPVNDALSPYFGGGGNSSSAVLQKPSSNAKVVKAYLLQEAIMESYESDILARKPMTLKGPKGGSTEATPLFNTIYAGDYNPSFHDATKSRHGVTIADVTSFVQQQGFGEYQGWDIPYWVNYPNFYENDHSASWKLIVIYEDEQLPIRMLSLRLGAVGIPRGQSLSLNIEGSGIKTRATGNVTGQIVVGGLGGDPDQVTSKMQLSTNGSTFYNLNTGKYGEVNTEDCFFQGMITVDGSPRNDIKSIGFRNSDNKPFHNNDLILMNVNNTQSNAQNGHNAYFENNVNKIIIQALNDNTASTISVLGMAVDIDVATYKSSIGHTGQAWQNIPLSMSAHLENNTNTDKSNIGVSGGYATIKVDSNINVDSTSIVATFYDKSSNQKVTLPSSMISVSGNTITVKYGRDANAISQVGDTLDVAFKGIPSKTGSYTNTIEMNANGIVDENGYSHVQNNTFSLTSSKDTFTTKYNNPPTITVTNKTFYEGEYTSTQWQNTIRWQGVKASDKEDGTYTKNQIKIVSDNVNVNKNGTYKVVYSVTDSVGQTSTATSTVTVKYNNPPVINAKDQTFYEGQYTDTYWKNTLRWKDVSASDIEDGNITSKIQITADNVNVNKPGVYNVTYKVTDKFGKSATKTVKITVKYNNPPVITGEDRWFYEDETITNQMLMERVKAKDIEDGDITKNAKIKSSNVQSGVVGIYEVTYIVTDAFGKSATTKHLIHIIASPPLGSNRFRYIRFIDSQNRNTLKADSIWRAEYASLLNQTLDQPSLEETWVLTEEDIAQIKAFNQTHDFSKESNDAFYELFSHLRK